MNGETSVRKPNILIFMTDHQRADTVLPEHPARMPHVERLAQEGLTFTQTYCPAPHCCPARATFFTGLYPSGHGVWNNICNRQALSTGLNDGVKLWSEDLRDAGYRLHFSGKWHVSVEESPADRGWSEHYVSGAKGAYHGVQWDHYRQLAAQPKPTARGEGEILRPGYGTYRLYGTGSDEGNPHDETAVGKALEVLNGLKESDQPWCLYIGAIAPHDPYIVPQRYLDMYDLDDVPLPPSFFDELADKPRIYQRMREMRFGQLSEREAREGIRHFWAYCTYLDDLFGQLLDALERTGQADNTLVLYTSDHGDYCGEHGLFAKGIPCFKGAYHIPAVIRWPDGIQNPGRRVDAFVSLADFAPTFIDLAGLPVDRHFAGRSLRPFLEDRTPDQWRDAIHTQCNGVELYYTQRSVMTNEFKYTLNGFDMDELYDLRRDPHEMHNLASDSAYAGVVREMCRRMWQFAYEQDDAAINPYITVGLAPYGPAEAFQS
ncbi:MAG: sulfatase-like hydrolase/transferase [Anaerolineae bacterium]|nr:sulfatase-like hydrolase/transferase [Anaerolineae bacterium]